MGKAHSFQTPVMCRFDENQQIHATVACSLRPATSGQCEGVVDTNNNAEPHLINAWGSRDAIQFGLNRFEPVLINTHSLHGEWLAKRFTLQRERKTVVWQYLLSCAIE